MIEATGHPRAGIRHALAAIEAGRHLVMVNVEADVLAGAATAALAGQIVLWLNDGAMAACTLAAFFLKALLVEKDVGGAGEADGAI